MNAAPRVFATGGMSKFSASGGGDSPSPLAESLLIFPYIPVQKSHCNLNGNNSILYVYRCNALEII